MTALVVGRNRNIDILGGGIGIAKGLAMSAYNIVCLNDHGTHDDGKIDVGSLLDSLSISTWVRDDDEARFLE